MVGQGGLRRDSVVRDPKVVARLGKESDAAIARDLKVSRERVAQIRRALDIPRYVPPLKTSEADVAGMIVDCLSLAEIRRRSGWAHRRIRDVARQYDLDGQLMASGRAVVVEAMRKKNAPWRERREMIREAWNAGAESQAIAEAFGFTSVHHLNIRVAGWRRRGYDFARRRNDRGFLINGEANGQAHRDT